MNELVQVDTELGEELRAQKEGDVETLDQHFDQFVRDRFNRRRQVDVLK